MTQDNFIHTWEALQILDITEPELMTLVSNAQLKGFDQNKQPVKHYGRYHVDQKEDERLSGAILSTLVSYFDRGDIIHYQQKNNLIPAQPPAAEIKPEKQINPAKIDPETFIKSLLIACISPTEISIKSGEEKAGDYKCGEIGFKESEKTWQMFIKVLQDSDHKFQTGIYSKDKSAIKNRNYHSRVKLTTNFSKKFVSFLNKKYNAELPESFNVFKNMKGLDRDGTYEPKFRIIDRRNSDNNKEIKKMSQEDTVRKIEELSKQRKSEKDETKKTMLLIEIGKYADHGKRNNYITEEWCRRIISPDDEPAANDAMSLIYDMTEKDKHGLF